MKARFEKQGIRLAAISYDSEAILKYFADRQHIDFPLLADPDSRVIRDYDVLNTEAVGQFQGMARPGYFFIDPNGEGHYSRKVLRSQVPGEAVWKQPDSETFSRTRPGSSRRGTGPASGSWTAAI